MMLMSEYCFSCLAWLLSDPAALAGLTATQLCRCFCCRKGPLLGGNCGRKTHRSQTAQFATGRQRAVAGDGVLTTAGRVLPSASSRAGPAHPCVKASTGKRK